VLRPDLTTAWKYRHFAYFKMPWAATTARVFDLTLVDRLHRRWSPHWTGAERDASVADAVVALNDRRVLRGALAYYKALMPSRLYLSKIAVPALIVGGGDDPPALQRAYAATPRRFTAPCEVVILDGAGHWPHREREAEFLDALLGFLSD
jgi:pimeloyl-ACP methyl ester carboxylesterase